MMNISKRFFSLPMPFRVNVLYVFTVAIFAIVLMHLNDRRAGGE